MCSEIGKIFSVKYIESKDENMGNQAYVQFQNITDATKAIEQFNEKEINGKKISVDIANKKNILFIKGENTPNFVEKLKEVFELYENVTFGDLQLSSNKQMTLITVRLPSERNAKAFLQEYRGHRDKYPLIKDCVDITGKHGLMKEFNADQKILYCVVSPLNKKMDREAIKRQILQKFRNVTQCDLREKNGVLELYIVFGTPKDIIYFITDLQKHDSLMQAFLEGNKPNIDYPGFLIKLMKKFKHNKYQRQMLFNPGMNQAMMFNPMTMNSMNQQMPPQFMNPMMMGNNPNMYRPTPFKDQGQGQGNIRAPQPSIVKKLETLEDVNRNMKEFENFSLIKKIELLRKFLFESYKKFPKLVDVTNKEEVEKLHSLFTDQDLFGYAEMLETLNDPAKLEGFLIEAKEEQ